jgi:hypothetical protein
VVDADQGNSMSTRLRIRGNPITRQAWLTDAPLFSAHAHHITATARRGSKPSHITHVHIGAPVYVGEDHKVCLGSSQVAEW